VRSQETFAQQSASFMNVLFFKEDFVQRETFAQQSASFMNVLFFKEDFVQRAQNAILRYPT
jgi:hypothetical protein